jgi:hypothetical protein
VKSFQHGIELKERENAKIVVSIALEVGELLVRVERATHVSCIGRAAGKVGEVFIADRLPNVPLERTRHYPVAGIAVRNNPRVEAVRVYKKKRVPKRVVDRVTIACVRLA